MGQRKDFCWDLSSGRPRAMLTAIQWASYLAMTRVWHLAMTRVWHSALVVEEEAVGSSSIFLLVEDVIAQGPELPSVGKVSSIASILIIGRRRSAKNLGVVLLGTLNENLCVAGRRRHERDRQDGGGEKESSDHYHLCLP